MKNNIDIFANKVLNGDCLEVMKELPDNSIDTIITDPPYGLEFMGKDWDKFKKGENIAGGNTGKDTPYARSKALPAFYQLKNNDKMAYQEFSYKWAIEALRVLKPGGCLLAFGGTRMYHRMTCGIEDAGFVVKDCICYMYGTGFPKSTNISKQIDKMYGVKQKIIGKMNGRDFKNHNGSMNMYIFNTENGRTKDKILDITEAATPEAKLWDGYGTALKPAYEPIVVAFKPNEGTFAQNALKYGVAGLNIDDARIEIKDTKNGFRKNEYTSQCDATSYKMRDDGDKYTKFKHGKGRFPANIILDEESANILDEQNEITISRVCKNVRPKQVNSNTEIKFNTKAIAKPNINTHADKGGASRYFKNIPLDSRILYTPKTSKKERDAGCDELKNNHPTVKPIALLEYLCNLTKTPTGGIVLDPFLGSGTTAIACVNTKRSYIGIEQDKGYCDIAEKRINYYKNKQKELLF